MKTRKYCCIRFDECVQEGFIVRAGMDDETAWYFDGGPHLYYCPFCGSNVKEKGYGQFDVEYAHSHSHRK